MKLIYKFSLPSLIQALLIMALLLYMAITGNTLINNLKNETNRINHFSEQLNNIIRQTDKYFLEKISQPAFAETVQSTLKDIQTNKSFNTQKISTGLEEVDRSIQKADELRKMNVTHINKILNLTEHSISQSNGYINLTVEKLADPGKRDQVSVLERMVIQGANNNTTANMKIQVLIYQMLKDYHQKSELLGFIRQSLENVEKDVAALKDTPFAGMALAAKEANLKVEHLVNQYITNVEAISNIESALQQRSVELQQSLQDIEMAGIENTFSEVRDLGLLLSVSLIVLSLLLVAIGFLLTRIVTSPLLSLKRMVSAVAENGDFSKQLETNRKDEIGETINAFNSLMDTLFESISDVNRVMEAVDSGDFTSQVTHEHKGDLNRLKTSINSSIQVLSDTIRQVIATSAQVNEGSSQLSSSSQALASGTTEQAASLEEVSSSMAEIGSKSKTNSENANQASQLSNQTLEVVGRGSKQMEAMLSSMDKISGSSSEISKIIKVIDEIAFQTNLLALNAAVEAARAGKYGKGFAVVAEEVRNLAARSAAAAKNTTELIENSVNEVDSGVSNAGKTAEILNEINLSISKVNDLVGEIAASSQEQSYSTDEINKSLNQVNEVVQQNSSISEEAASASQELSSQAMALQSLMGRFKLNQIAETPNRKTIPVQQDVPAEQKKGVTKMITLDDDNFGKY
ncbi:HAMP domain-containing protein [bacterium]|nr:HAMP domain-containing protein [bacterium]